MQVNEGLAHRDEAWHQFPGFRREQMVESMEREQTP
jgi:hypothetical protein